MLVLILNQKDKRVEQIMFENNLSQGQKTLLYAEKKLKIFFALMTVSFLPFLIKIFESFVDIHPDYENKILGAMKVVFYTHLLILNITFWWLFALMKRLHGFEFDQNNKQFIVYYFVFIAVLMMDFLFANFNYYET
jgi:hypothetical protein